MRDRDRDGLRTSEFWREKAEEARAAASEMYEDGDKTIMERVADLYDHMAQGERA